MDIRTSSGPTKNMTQPRLYLSGYWDATELPPHENHGQYSEDSHGMPSEWVIGPKPGEEHVTNLICSVPYLGTRFAFIFYLYALDEALADAPIYKKLCAAGVASSALVSGLPLDGRVFIYQTDEMLPDFKPYTGGWGEQSFDELGASIDCIDTEHEIVYENVGEEGLWLDPVDRDPPSEDD